MEEKVLDEKAILLVSFGTSHIGTKKKTLDHLKEIVTTRFQEAKVYEAYTSKTILRILKERENLKIDSIKEALERIRMDGKKKLIVQPTHLLCGIEYETIVDAIRQYKEWFDEILLGTPLCSYTRDYQVIVEQLPKVFKAFKEREALILMGHGTNHPSNACYGALNDMFQYSEHPDTYLGTVEAYPTIEDIIQRIEGKGYQKVYLAPFMMVAGEHANNDMIGESPSSWERQLKNGGYEVEVILKGLGEYPFIEDLLCEHIKTAKRVFLDRS